MCDGLEHNIVTGHLPTCSVGSLPFWRVKNTLTFQEFTELRNALHAALPIEYLLLRCKKRHARARFRNSLLAVWIL